jgi:uncharacterized membrane protein (DUF4010 family)
MNELDWKQPALVGGVVAGILSVIPVVSIGNCCFCAWMVLGGAIAAKLVVDRTPRPVKSGEGAKVGLMAGLIGVGISLVIGVLLLIAGVGEGLQRSILAGIAERSSDPQIQEMMQKMLEASAAQTMAEKVIAALPFMIVGAIFQIGFSVLGGLLGIAMFEKRKDQFPPSQYPPNYPPNYPPQSGPYGGGYGGGSGSGQGGWPPT